ncbi:MAG: sigma-70 family RNA polymerase sigma factor [Phycisphaerae bacterium]|nr:sigma-70 family RNA polymerase sigma factor [Phycisphaerae bacterium]
MVATAKKRTGGAKPSVGRALRQQIQELLKEDFSYIDSPAFRRKGIERELFDADGEPDLPLISWYQPTRDEPDDAVAMRPVLIKPSEERRVFLCYNYAKLRLSRLKRQILRQGLTRESAEQFLFWHRRYEHFREYLARTNLALVLAMAKRTRLGDVDFAEIVSEGNMALLRAIDKFNADKGFKFSTYACRAILKAFSRTAQKHSRHRQHFPVEFDPELEKSDWVDTRRDVVEQDWTDELKQIVDRNLADLSSIEQTVLRRRFNWHQEEESPLTLEEVGKIIGVTKERVRQIQNKALMKIRALMEDKVMARPSEPSDSPGA